MKTITFTNANDDSLVLSEAFPYLFQDLDLGDPRVMPMSQKNYNQDGECYYGSRMDPRGIDFSIVVKGNTRLETLEMRRRVYDVFNPRLGLGTLIYDDGYNKWRINAAVTYGPLAVETISDRAERLSIGLYAPDPAWEGYQLHAQKLVGSIGGMRLPCKLPCRLGKRGDQKEIDYQGSLDAPLLIEFRGAATLPKISKKETGEFIEVNVDLLEDEILYVSTNPSDVDVYIVDGTGKSRPAFNYLNPESNYMMLSKGMNTISFGAAFGSPEVFLYWHDRYVGV